jgi:YD repeat-containing protein
MKKLALLISLFIIQLIFSQEDSGGTNTGFDYGGEMSNLMKFPKSPEAEAFEKYGNAQVDLYTGRPNIEIPLHVLEGREISLPLSISYDASGIKVEQVATNVGLGWNLTCGGRISLIANGQPDYGNNFYTPASSFIRDKINEYVQNRTTFTTITKGIEYLNFLKNVAAGNYDAQYDYYSLNVLGINDYIVFDSETYQPKALKNPRIKIQGSPTTGWVVTGEDGTKFLFEIHGAETTQTHNQDGNTTPIVAQTYKSSWLLTKIISKNNKDEIVFNYATYNWNNSYKGSSTTSKSVTKEYGINVGNPFGSPKYQYDFQPLYKTTQLMPQSITLNGTLLAFFGYSPREDIIFETNSGPDLTIGNALTMISFPYECNQKEINFEYSYFGSSSPSATYKEKRLKLDKLTIKGSITFSESNSNPGNVINEKEKIYEFEYLNPESVPSLDSMNQDYLGLNNCAGNSDLVPGFSLGNYSFPGANRNPNLICALTGTLNKIIYPTGGYTEFEYEGNSGIINPVFEEISTFRKFAEVNVEPGIGSAQSASTCMQDAYTTYPKAEVTTFTLTDADFLPLVGIHQSGLRAKSDIFIITNGYAFIHKIENGCNNYIGPFQNYNGSFITDENGDYVECNNQTPPFNCISICTDSAPTLVPSNTMCFTNPITSVYGSYFNTGGIMGSAVAPGYNLEQNTSAFNLNSPGVYQLTIFNDPSNFNSVGKNALVYRQEVYARDNGYSGFRIKKIKDFQNDGIETNNREFIYANNLNGTEPSGYCLTPNEKIMIKSNISKQCVEYGNGKKTTAAVESYTMTTSGEKSQQNHIVYSSVFEVNKVNDLQKGYTQHKFNVGVSGFINISEQASYFEHNETIGKPIEVKVFNKNNNLVSSEKTEYKYFDDDSNNYSTCTGLVAQKFLSTSEGGNQAVVYKSPYSNECLLYYHTPEWACLGAPYCCPIPNLLEGELDNIELNINTTNFQGVGSYETHDYDLVPTFANSIFGAPIMKKSTSYLSNGEISQTQEFEYDKDADYLLRETRTTDSDNQTIRQKNYYPIDLHPSMYGDGRKTEVIKTESYVSDELILSRENKYADHTNGWFVEEIMVSKGTQNLETRMFIEYDSNDNIKEIKNSEDSSLSMSESYIWGYNNKFPVAKISGLAYSSIPSNLITAIQANSIFTCSEPFNEQLYNAFVALRIALPNSLITTYTYNSYGKPNSITDPKGQTSYFEYDELQRLIKVKDQDGNILSENEYHFRTQN